MRLIKTIVGISKRKKILDLTKNKKILIWGTGPIARELYCTLQGHAIKIYGFLDDRVDTDNTLYLNKKVFPFKFLNHFEKKKYFIFIAATEYYEIAKNYLETKNLKKNINFASWLKISRPHAIVKFLNFGSLSYSQIYKKILKEIKFISKIEIWFENNFDFRHLRKKDFEIGDKSFLNSFNLKINQFNFLKKIKKLQQSQIYIHIGDEIEDEKFFWKHYNFFLKELRKKNSILTETNIKKNLNIFIYSSKILNNSEIIKLKKILSQKKIKYWNNTPYIMPYDRVLKNLQQSKNIYALKDIYKYFTHNIKRYLKLAKKDSFKVCLCQRVFPIIQNDNLLKHCPLYEEPNLSHNALNVNFNKIINERRNNQFCKKCQYHGLHRFDINVLNRDHKL